MIRSPDHKDLAVFTIVQEEHEFIHPWINHFKRHLADPKDIHVLVHPPSNAVQQSGSDANPAWTLAQSLMRTHHGVTALQVHHASAFDHLWLAETIASFQAFLLQSYEWVLFAEIDEFVLPMSWGSEDPPSLLEFVRSLGPTPPPAVRATGFEIIEQDDEPPVPTDLYGDGRNASSTVGELIADRKWWYRSSQYSKTILANKPLRWEVGFHRVKGFAKEISLAEPSLALTLVHLHRADRELAWRRLRRSRSRKWSQYDVQNQWGVQNRWDDKTFNAFWNSDADTNQPLQPGRLSPIPPCLYTAFRRAATGFGSIKPAPEPGTPS
jgi:hypothetical protein